MQEITTPAAPAEGQPILTVRNVVKRYGGVTALNDVDFDIYPGRVHSLAGENGCGKSTLVKVISGVEKADSGVIEIAGKARSHLTPAEAMREGVQVIYQDFSLFPNLTVAENIMITEHVAHGRGLYSRRRSRPIAEQIVKDLDLNLDLDADVESLSVANRQLTAICRALVNDAKVIFMDEPTTALTHTEVESLFAVVQKLQERNVALVFISHKLEEALEFSQDITIMRSGKVVVSGPRSQFDRASMIRHMTGREVIENRNVTELDSSGTPRLSVRDISLTGAFTDVSFDVAPGEILGISGLLGSGRSEIVEALFGLHPITSGTIEIDGEPVRINSIKDAIDSGIGYVPSDRLTEGLFLEKSIADNTISASLDRHRRGIFTDRSRVADTIDTFFTRLRIKSPDVSQPVRSLSGGNAQRVVVAKWLANEPGILMLNGPTVGVDVGSKEEILEILRVQARQGMSIIIVSDDVPELVAVCHRILVVKKGRIISELTGDEVSIDLIHERMAS